MLAEKVWFKRNDGFEAWLTGIRQLGLANRLKFAIFTPDKMTSSQQFEVVKVLAECLVASKSDSKLMKERVSGLSYLRKTNVEAWFTGLRTFDVVKRFQHATDPPQRISPA